MRYYSMSVLTGMVEDYYCNVDISEKLSSQIMAGEKISIDTPEIGLVVETEGFRHLLVETGMFLLSKKALQATLKVTGKESNYLPVTSAVFTIGRKTKSYAYYLWIPPVLDCIDRVNSEIIIEQNEKVKNVQVKKLRFVEGISEHIFRSSDLPYHIFVSEVLMNKWNEKEFEGIIYVSEEEFSDSYFDFID